MDTTSIANLASGISQSNLGNSVGIAVASKTLDAQREEGAAMVALITSAQGPSVPGVGEQVDVTA